MNLLAEGRKQHLNDNDVQIRYNLLKKNTCTKPKLFEPYGILRPPRKVRFVAVWYLLLVRDKSNQPREERGYTVLALARVRERNTIPLVARVMHVSHNKK